MSPRHVRAAAFVAAFALAPAVTVLSASAGMIAAAALWPHSPSQMPRAVTENALPIRPAASLTPVMASPLQQFDNADAAAPLAAWRAAEAESTHASASGSSSSDWPPAAPRPLPPTQPELPPFALILLVVTSENSISKALSPVSYPDRGACEQAGLQWELGLSQAIKAQVRAVCMPQAADLLAMGERLQATMPGASTLP